MVSVLPGAQPLDHLLRVIAVLDQFGRQLLRLIYSNVPSNPNHPMPHPPRTVGGGTLVTGKVKVEEFREQASETPSQDTMTPAAQSTTGTQLRCQDIGLLPASLSFPSHLLPLPFSFLHSPFPLSLLVCCVLCCVRVCGGLS